jgi:hypothetical protein
MTTTDLQSSGSSVARQASTVTGWSSTPTRPPADKSSKPAFYQTARCCSPMKQPTTLACTRSMVQSATPCTNGRAMTTVMVSAKSIATHAKGLGPPCAPSCASSGVCINITWPNMWRLSRPCSTLRLSLLLSSSACALVIDSSSPPHKPRG